MTRLVPAVVLLAAAGGEPAWAAGQVEGLAADTVWSGRIVLDHTVVVRKGATLTVNPGTRVEFLPKDGDGDGIGDLALRVEGRLLAAGTRREPIVFTSASADPKPSDWMFVILEFSRDSVVEHCRFSYAYSGLQVHYSTVQVRNCVFSGNVDGFRFSTANAVAENCLMEGNVNGIRYEERKGRTRVSRNVIRNNDIGIFCVTEAEDLTVFRDNNLEGNRRYNLKMGMLQKRDISLPGNWWGTDKAGEIAATIYDGRSDPALGKVAFEPFLTLAVPGAGPDITLGNQR